MRKRGISLIEILIAIAVSAIIILAITTLFIGSNRAFLGNRAVSELSEDVRSAITTLEFVFSRWGAGVPCRNNECIILPALPECEGYPPTDPQCITIRKGSPCDEVEFFASLYGYGFILNTSSGITAISCRLVDDRNEKQNCYLYWNETGVKFKGDKPEILRITRISKNNQDCLQDPDQAIVTLDATTTLLPGTVLIRAPHRIVLRCIREREGVILMMDREDTVSDCGENENAVRVGRVEYFSMTKTEEGRAIKMTATFISSDGKKYPVEKYFGR